MIIVKDSIVADNGEVFSLRLGDQHVIERIPMISRKCTCTDRVRKRNRWTVESLLVEKVLKIAHKVLACWQFSETNLGCNFPRGGGADQDFVASVLDQARCSRTYNDRWKCQFYCGKRLRG